MLDFDELWKRLNDLDETVEIEAKAAKNEIGKSTLETISAFANEPGRGGGYILLGVGEAPAAGMLFSTGYEVRGVQDADKIQTDLASQCRSAFNHSIRPEISVVNRDGRKVVIAFIPEAQPSEKPIYISARGLPKGAFRRIGGADHVCTDDDVAMLHATRTHRAFDETIIDDAELDDLDPDAIKEYRKVRKEANPDAPELDYDDEELLQSLACATRVKGILRPTIAGLMLFGKRAALRRRFPMMRVDYIRVPGREWVPDTEKRYDAVELLGPLMLIIPRAINAILDDIPKAFHLPPDADRRQDVPLVPRKAIREAVVNAVMHRTYQRRQAVQIIRFSNRLEIRNPGHSLVADDRLGEPGSETRNDKIAAVLHETNYAETKGTGIGTMRKELAKAGLAPPTFESDREKDEFAVTFLFHHFLNEDDIRWLANFKEMNLSDDESKALIFAREVGGISNDLYRHINHTDTLSASGRLRRLRDAGLLEQRGKGRATHYVPTERLLNPAMKPGANASTGSGSSVQKVTNNRGSTPLPTGSDALVQESPSLTTGVPPSYYRSPPPLVQELGDLPPELREVIQSLGKRAAPSETKRAIRLLCAWKPMRAEELERVLGRGQGYLTRTILGPMLRDNELEYTIPDKPNHPDQAYRATSVEGTA